MSRIVTECDSNKWKKFLINHSEGNIFQSEEIYSVYLKTKNYSPIKLFSINESNGDIEGLLISNTINDMGKIMGFIGSRTIIQGGPLIKNNSKHVLIKLIGYYNRIIKNKTIFTEIRNSYEVKDFLSNIDYEYEDHLNYHINLTLGIDKLWSNIHKSRKKNIKKSDKKGVIIEEINNEDEMNEFNRLLKETYDDVKIPLADRSLFNEAYKQLYPKGLMKIFFAKYKGMYIGTRAILLFKDVIFDWYAGSSRDHLNLNPDSIIVWHLLKWGYENGFSLFDFGGAGKPEVFYGPREFKRRFGGKLVCYGRYTKVHSPIKMKFALKGFELYKKIT